MTRIRFAAGICAFVLLSAGCSTGSPDQGVTTAPTGGIGGDPASSITVTRADGIIVMIATLKGDSSSVATEATLAKSQQTSCLTDGYGHPLALPIGTTLDGAGDSVAVLSPDGQRFELGDKIYGGGSLLDAGALAADYGTTPTECGPAPWLVLHAGLRKPPSDTQ